MKNDVCTTEIQMDSSPRFLMSASGFDRVKQPLINKFLIASACLEEISILSSENWEKELKSAITIVCL